MLRKNFKILKYLGVVFLVFSLISCGSKETPQEVKQTSPAGILFEQAKSMRASGQRLDAKRKYQKILEEHFDYEQIDEVQQELFKLNKEIIFSNMQTPDAVIHEVVSGDTLGKLAQKHKTTIDLIKINNGLKNDVIRIGQRLRIWNAPFNVLVDKSQNTLFLKKGDEVVYLYEISTGTDNNTPVGNFKITTKLVDPVWFKSGAIIAPESPQNVLGTRWLGFDMPGYGIHGTVEPETIGQQATAGCVRMRNEEVEELYSLLPLGTKVVIVD